MASHLDAMDILEMDTSTHSSRSSMPSAEQLKESLSNPSSVISKKAPKKPRIEFKKPEGMAREVYALLYSDKRDLPPLIPTDTFSYTTNKVNFNSKLKVRPWRWTPFENPARKDGAVFYHWRREEDAGKEYPFARFNKKLDMPSYTDVEYNLHLQCDGWTREETDYLMEMCYEYDLRFVIISDRYDMERFESRSVEDLKERYYDIKNIIEKVRSGMDSDSGPTSTYDAAHERVRKRQLEIILNRSPEEEDEIDYLQGELKKIEMRQKERDKKKHDLQKLLTAVDTMDAKRLEKKKKIPLRGMEQWLPESAGIRWPDMKQSTYLRSNKMKLPNSMAQKKIKVIDQVLADFDIDANPCPTEKIVTGFNELRSQIVLLYEMKLALANSEFELQSLIHRFNAVNPKKLDEIVRSLPSSISNGVIGSTASSSSPTNKISDIIDLNLGQVTPSRKRKAALEQSSVMMRLKKSA